MARVNAPIYSLNGGEVGEEGLARLDLERLQFAGSLYQNMLPRIIGSMTLRPGLEHIADADFGDLMLMEYSYSGSASLLPILSSNEIRFLKDNAYVSRVTVSTTVTNGDFGSFSGWTDTSDGGATATVSGGFLRLAGTPQDTASAQQAITVSSGDFGKEHGLRIEVTGGPVTVRAGYSSGSEDLLFAEDLDDGTHSLTFTPTSSPVYIELINRRSTTIIIASCQIEGAGTVVLPTPWTSSDIAGNIIRYKQHKDVIYTASKVYQQRQIQHRSDTSWGIQRYKVDDGPFVSSDGTIALQPNGYTGNVVLTASKEYFKPGMVGRLFRLFQSGQAVVETFSSAPVEGEYIRVSGVGGARAFAWQLSGTWSGTAHLQVATDDGSGSPGAWTDVLTRVANDNDIYTDEDDNVVKFFRWALNIGDLSSGDMQTSLVYSGGSRSGVARMTAYLTPTTANAEILSRFYSTTQTFEWDYSTWSDMDGWPAAVEAFGGRLYWGMGDMIYGSVPDAYKSFDDEVEGDSAPIVRSIGSNAQRGILWLLGLQRLVAGTDLSEISIKSSSFDEPLTASSWFPVESSTQGGLNIRAVKCDTDGIFVQTSGTGIFALVTNQGSLDYGSVDLTAMHEHICDGYDVVDFAVQRRPDTIVWFVLENGEARALTYRPSEKVIAWSRIVTDGTFKRVAVNRSNPQDDVYFAVVRNGTQRIERLANLMDCRGGAVNCMADGFKRFSGSPATVFSVPHLNGRAVVVWADGRAVHDQDNLYTVSGNQVVLSQPASNVVIGLPYTGLWKSTKLAYGAQGGTALFQHKKVSQLGLYLINTMLDGLRVGKDFATMHRFTTTKKGRPIAANELQTAFDADMMAISSDWDTDSRVCVEAKAPYPFTAAAMVLDLKTNG